MAAKRAFTHLSMNQVNHVKAHQALCLARNWTNFCLISYDDCAVNSHGINEYGELGFDSGEGA